MNSLYILNKRLFRSQEMLGAMMDRFGEPNGWDLEVEMTQKEIEAAKNEQPDKSIEDIHSTKALMWKVMDIGNQGNDDGRIAELELLRRLSLEEPVNDFQGPASLVMLKDGNLVFLSISPFETMSGVFLAYDIGYYD